MSQSRLRLPFLAAAFIVGLRVLIGWHFFKEGAAKTHDPSFSSAGFLTAAKGPAAPFYHSMLRDPDGITRLGFSEGPGGRPAIDLEPTLNAWEVHRQAVSDHYGFGDEALISRLEASKTKENGKDVEQKIARVKSQPAASQEILDNKKAELEWFVDVNRADIEEYFRGLARRKANEADAARSGVDSLRGQSDKIVSDMAKKRGPWLAQIDKLWKDYDRQLAALAISEQRERGVYVAAKGGQRAFDVDTIDKIIPYFDLTVGALLILGLFTRLAAIAGGLFLASVVASQWPGFEGAAPTYYQAIEMMALFALAAIGAGRYFGIDSLFYLFSASRAQKRAQNRAEANRSTPANSSSRPAGRAAARPIAATGR